MRRLVPSPAAVLALAAVLVPAAVPSLAAALAPDTGAAQDGSCRLHGVGAYSRSVRADGSDSYRHYGSGGIDYRCDDGVRIQGDSAVVFEASNQIHLFGDVRFADRTSELRADSAFYFGDDRQLRAWGSVRVEDHESGTIITGSSLNYFRASSIRALDRLEVYEGQPHATVRPPRPAPTAGEPDFSSAATPEASSAPGADSSSTPTPDSSNAAAPNSSRAVMQDSANSPAPDSGSGEAGDAAAAAQVPYEIDADHFVLEGRRIFTARNDVFVARDSLAIRGDTLIYDLQRGVMTVEGNARVEEQDFELTAPWLTAQPHEGGDMVLAGGGAQLTGQSMLMLAPAIRVFLAQGVAHRLLALRRPPAEDEAELTETDMAGLSPGDQARLQDLFERQASARDEAGGDDVQPSVSTAAFSLWADSIEVVAPGQALDVVNAVGAARAETHANQAVQGWNAPDIAASDWMTGDTIVARFVPGAAPAPGEPPAARLETLTASGSAVSFYRLAPADTLEADEAAEAAPPPALHYVAGDRITVLLEGGEVVEMDVEGQTVGHHWEPAPPAEDTIPPDTVPPPLDTIPPDTIPLPSDTIPPDTVSIPSDTIPPDAIPPPPDTTRQGEAAGRRPGRLPWT